MHLRRFEVVVSAGVVDLHERWIRLHEDRARQQYGNAYVEYMGLDVLDGTAYIAWADSRHFYPASTGESQKENLGFTKVVFRSESDSIFADGFESGDVFQWAGTSH